MKVTPTTPLMALSPVTILKEGKTGKKPPGLTKRYKKECKNTWLVRWQEKTNTVCPAYCVFCPRHKHSISFPKAFTYSKKTKSEPKKKNTDDDIPQKTDLKIFLEECILLEKANLLFCSFVHFDKFLVAALTHPTCQRG